MFAWKRCIVAGLTGGLLLGASALTTSRGLGQGAPSDPSDTQLSAVVRNELGQLKWLALDATDYTPLEAAGRELYLESGCKYCHSQYDHPEETETRPWGVVSADRQRWGPEVEPGEYVFDDPPVFGAEGIAPDLSRTGLKYGDEWHLAHFWDPRQVRPGSIMGGFSGYFGKAAEPIAIVEGPNGPSLEATPETEALFDFASEDIVQLTPNGDGLVFVPLSAQGKNPVIWTPNDEYAGDTVTLAAETTEIAALTAYVQKLGTNRGMWRQFYTPASTEGPATTDTLERSDAAIERGKVVYERNCVGCHGVKGDGNGPSAAFMTDQRPRNFTFGVFKFKHTDGPIPTDADLLRTITRGVSGTAMPAWFELPLDDRLAVIQYIKYVLAADLTDPNYPYLYFVEEPLGQLLEIGEPPAPTKELVARGNEIWLQAKCWECHGKTGKGDGEKAAGLRDDWGFAVVPANLTRGQFKSGPTVTDIYRTITVGLNGTPMPAFKNAFPDEDRWALAHYILSLSAFTDPLTGQRLALSDEVREALNDPGLETPGPEQAYGRTQSPGSGL